MTTKSYHLGYLIGLFLVGMLPLDEQFNPDYGKIEAMYHVDRVTIDLAVSKANGKIEVKCE